MWPLLLAEILERRHHHNLPTQSTTVPNHRERKRFRDVATLQGLNNNMRGVGQGLAMFRLGQFFDTGEARIWMRVCVWVLDSRCRGVVFSFLGAPWTRGRHSPDLPLPCTLLSWNTPLPGPPSPGPPKISRFFPLPISIFSALSEILSLGVFSLNCGPGSGPWPTLFERLDPSAHHPSGHPLDPHPSGQHPSGLLFIQVQAPPCGLPFGPSVSQLGPLLSTLWAPTLRAPSLRPTTLRTSIFAPEKTIYFLTTF